jgi:hypothetical protein
VLPGQPEPPEIRGWKISIWFLCIIDKGFSALGSYLQFLCCLIPLLSSPLAAFPLSPLMLINVPVLFVCLFVCLFFGGDGGGSGV